ncbi:MAG: YGGT family protein [Chloroflexi bacterium ADurb.Bin180]|nr:MAG: YGGT family protein [Chloroflexi bacterium ADurb.Bin180]HOU23445.1 YggT family protein [Anaerolineae bacterium]HQJ51174.1 YggT family protein [Anaerolineae bacterium]
MTYTLYRLVDFVFWFLSVALLLRVLLSWVNMGSGTFSDWIFRLTEPILAPLRRVIPPIGGLDFSPMVALFLLELLHTVVNRLLF